MEYDLIQLAKECPGLTVSIKLTDLVEANKELIEETKRNLQQTLEDAKSEEYLSREKVIEWLEVSGIRKSTACLIFRKSCSNEIQEW